ncbi:fibronectin type III domain-containing protein [Lacinutrix chionoecetis]
MKTFSLSLLLSFFIYTAQAQCPEPTNLAFFNITETTVDISWTENGTATTWEIETVLGGATPSGTGISVTNNPFTVSSLVSGENYDFYIRSNCGANGFSAWVGPLNVTTLSCIFSIDAVENPGACLEYCFYANGAQFGTFFDFNSGVLPAGWNSSPFTVGSPCLTDMIDNSPYFWAGVTDSNGERQVTTNPLDVTLGGIIQFYMRYGADDPDPGCETADLPEEGINLQYSIDNGATWVNINYWQPTDILTDPLYSWTQYTETIPAAAQTNSSMFRWYQSDNSGPQFDNWGLDNVLVSANTNANFLWDFGDGNSSTLSAPCHTYASEGPFTVTLMVDAPNCNNTVSTNIVVEDSVPPTAVCQNITIDLDINGNATIAATDIDNGSTDNCGIQAITLSQTNFSCNDVGQNNVTMTVTDPYGNIDSCVAIVTVNPTISAPTAVTIIPLSPTSAEITWTPGGTETSWEIEIVPAGTPPTGTGIITSTIPYLATPLTEDTDYDVYIQGISGTGCSEWAGPNTFSTPCTVLAVPYVEPVETQITGSADAIDNCWNAESTVFSWRANSFGTNSTGTGPDAAANGTNYFYTEATGANTGDVAILLSPFFDLTTSSNTYLHFFYHMYGSNMGELHVDLFNGATWVDDVFVITGQQQSSNSAAWVQEFIDISAYETVANFQVRFRGIRGDGFRSDMAIDDITIESILACPEPTNFMASNPTATTIDLSWTSPATVSQWQIEAVETGNTPTGAGITVTTNPFTFTGLNPNVTYDFYIIANCNDGTNSNWVGPVTLATICNDISFNFCPNDLTIDTDAAQCFGTPNYNLPTIIDNCDATNTTVTLTAGLAPDGEFPIGTTTVTYSASNAAGTTVTCTFDVTVNDPFSGLNLQASETINANTVTLCNDNTVDLSATGGDFDGSETYQWQLNGTTINGENSSILSAVNTTGDYTAIVSLGTCSMSFTISINQIDADASFTYNAPQCDSATVTLSGTAGGTFQFEILPTDNAILDTTTGMISNGEYGETYSVTYTTQPGPCQTSETQNVTLLELDDAGFYIEDESITCYSANIIVTGTSIGVFTFDPIPFDNATINQTTGEITNTTPNTTYTIVYTTNAVCSNTESVTYTTPINCIIPQGISPNDDDFNDYFDISWLRAEHLYIYNRYGNQVYDKKDYRKEWNGFSNKEEILPTGTYFYVINTEDSKPITGWVYINRG